MATNVVFPSKNVLATVQCSFDFLSMLGLTETITSALCGVFLDSGEDPTPAAILVGGTTISGKTVNQLVGGGLVGVTYLVACNIVTSLGRELVMNGLIAVIDDNPYQQ